MKSVTWSFHVDDSQKHSQYDMIIGRYSLLELKLDLCFIYYMVKVNGGAYEVCTAPMKFPYNLCDDTIFRNEKDGKVNMYPIPRNARVGSWTQTIKSTI